ncbi:MAG: HEAT repeat domain-containing protein [Bacteroidales bacterium]|nr:HEAT repeat domain-containing protein [Bacteroidales bacterium]
MKSGLLKAFSIEADEAKGVSIFITQSIFIGIFYGTFEITASALFLDYFEPTMLTKAYAVSGLFGIILTLIYSALQERINFSKVAVINLLSISVITFLLRFLFPSINIKIIVFLLIVVYGPLRIIALVGFWGAVGRIFSLRQGKRLFGLIDSGWIFGIILSSYLVPILLRFNVETKNLLYISAISIVLALITQFFLSKNFNLNIKESGKKEKELGLFEMLKNPYILVISIFVSLSMMTAFFILYEFMAVTKDNYPGSKEFASFLGFFFGTMMIFILLIKTFIYSRLIKTYGLKIALIISPILLIFFTLLAAIIGSIFGYTAAAANFTFFFLLIALSRLFAGTLKDAIEVPSFKILYQSIDKAIRFNVQAKVDGTINEISALFSGILLALLGMLPFFKTIHFSYCLIIILVLWTIYAFRLYKYYQLSLQESLSKAIKTTKSEISEITDQLDIIKDQIDKVSPEKKRSLYKFYELFDPLDYEKLIIKNYNKENTEIKEFLLNEIARLKLTEAITLLKDIEANDKNQKLKSLSNSIIQIFNQEYLNKKSEEQIEKLANSSSQQDKIKACKLLKIKKNNEYVLLINKLLRDFNVQVRQEAIKGASQIYNDDTIVLLTELLENDNTIAYSSSALIQIGNQVIDNLDHSFYKTEISNNVLARIVKIIGKIKDKKSINSLINKLEHINTDIQYNTIISLRQNDYKPDETTNLHIHESIENQIAIIGWNLAAQLTCEEYNVSELLKQAIQDELDVSYNKLFLLLSIAYDSRSIEHVRENLESGTAEGIGFAIELLDQFVFDELKPKLFPVLEDTATADKIKQLQNNYPVDKSSIPELLFDIINRDLNCINHWTKACALNELRNTENLNISNDLIAQLFNPDPMLSEISAEIIYKINPDIFIKSCSRLKQDIKNQLIEKTTKEFKNGSMDLFKKVIALKQCNILSPLPGNSIYKIILNSDFKKIEAKKDIEINNLCFVFIHKGLINLIINNKSIKQFTENEEINLFNYKTENNGSLTLKTENDSSFFALNNTSFSKLINEDIKISQRFISF